MPDSKGSLDDRLINDQNEGKVTFQINTQPQGMEIKRPQQIPLITLSGLTLCIICPLLIVVHFQLSHLTAIPIIQYLFMTLLVGSAINYLLVIRKYDLMPFLSENKYDNQVKFAWLLGFVAILCSLTWGWNGSGGMIFAILWQKVRGNKLGTFSFLYLLVIIGSLLMQDELCLHKLIQFIPGILIGISASLIFTLKQSSTYIIAHQFMFFTSLCLPMFFPLNHIVVPTLFQWGVMIIAGIGMYWTVIWTVKLLQKERVSIVMAVTSGIIILGISSYFTSTHFIGALIIVIGLIFILKKEYLDLQF